jgi:RNA polymerase sigma-70 factor, ECF subfamily
MSLARAYLTVVPKEDAAHLTDRELVGALLRRESGAAELAWRRHAPRIFAVVQRTMGPYVDAEDITQDIFLRVFARLPTLKDPDAFSHFVLSVALRVIKWQLRRRRVRRILQLAPTEVPELPVPALDAEACQALRRFYQLLDTLPVAERTVFVLRHLEGMDLRELAEAIGMSLATTKRRLRRATARMTAEAAADPALAQYTKGTER